GAGSADARTHLDLALEPAAGPGAGARRDPRLARQLPGRLHLPRRCPQPEPSCRVGAGGGAVMGRETTGITLLGGASQIPDSPEKALLERVANPHADTAYVARF